MAKKAVEQTGLIPRSIIRTFDRFRKQLFPQAEKLIIQEFRISRYQFLVSIKCLASLIFIPLTVNFVLKNFLLIPLTENFWNNKQSDIFLNSYQQNQAFNELQKFQEKLYFDYLTNTFDVKQSLINDSPKLANLLVKSSQNFCSKCNKKKFCINTTSNDFYNEKNINLVQYVLHTGANYLPNYVLDHSSIKTFKVISPFLLFENTSACPVREVHRYKVQNRKMLKSEISFIHQNTPKQLLLNFLFRNREETIYALKQISEIPSAESAKSTLYRDALHIQLLKQIVAKYSRESLVRSQPWREPKNQVSNIKIVKYPVEQPYYLDGIKNVKFGAVKNERINESISNARSARVQSTIKKHKKNYHFYSVILTQKAFSYQVEILNNQVLQQDDIIKKLIKDKILELAVYYNHQSILALVNLISDFVTFIVITAVIIYMKPQISILKSFLTESIYSLNDTKKSFLLILGTDLLVGFHSPRGWEICLELILRHFGLPENKDFVFLFVASFPVLLDTVFKYWIFRYLNKISPSTVATYHSMIE